jgi:CxxC motif-containing protein (DUF1111 family)
MRPWLIVSLVAFTQLPAAGAGMAPPALPGGATTVFDDTRNAFSFPARNLREQHRAAFFVGNSFFNDNWTSAPGSVDSRDGLGPLFNARSCSGCHFKDGRGRPPEPGGVMRTMLLRVSVPGRGPHGAPRPDPHYGDQIQGAALPGLPAEADVVVDYDPVDGQFPDGQRFSLRRPRYRLANAGYGPPRRDLQSSARVAPAMIGLGLLEAVPDSQLEALADPEDRDGDGISGRPNQTWDVRGARLALGRFGWKAEQPSVLQQAAAAFAGDMGITSSLFPRPNHTARQPACAGRPSGGTPEVSDEILRQVALYARTLAVPARRRLDDPVVGRGQRLFAAAGCAACHRPSLHTGPSELPELADQVIFPYTDLLLHDLGEGLSDHRPSFRAAGSEWRTAALWGLGLYPKVNGHGFLLHDGRARSVTEAVLWHEGEAARARQAFMQLPAGDRAALVAFVESL